MHNLLNSFLAVNEEERFFGLKKKALSGVCSSGVRFLNAKPTKIQENRKQGFRKDFPQHFNHTTFE